MRPVLVDSCVILDVATGDPRWAAWSEAALEDAGDRAVLVVNPIIVAEVSVGFERIEDLDAAVPRRLRFRTSTAAPMPPSWGIGC